VKTLLVVILMSCCLSCTSCEPYIRFVSVKTNSEYETIDFGNFSLKAEAGYGSGNAVAIALTIEALDSLTFWGRRLQVQYAGAELNYEILDEGKRLKDTYRLYRQEKIVIYLLKRNIFTIPKGEPILLYGPQIFQVRERYYDLDTLKFVALKTYLRSY